MASFEDALRAVDFWLSGKSRRAICTHAYAGGNREWVATGRVNCPLKSMAEMHDWVGPRPWLAGCALGNVVAVRCDVGAEVTAEIAALAAPEPAFTTWNSPS